MGRKVTVDQDTLINQLTHVFRNAGYEGASLNLLQEATGLKKASLYHRFPQGKEEMAREVLQATEKLLKEDIITILASDATPETRIKKFKTLLNQFYSGGNESCLLNVLAMPVGADSLFSKEIKNMFKQLSDALAIVASDAGFNKAESKFRAERAIMLLQGSLVYSRGIGSTRPFQDFLRDLHTILIGE